MDDIIIAAEILWYIKHNNIKTCQICKCSKTPLWRTCKQYKILCNRCGIKMQRREKTKKHNKL